jgi:ABC-type amino acid transport system permease subunit
MYRRVSDGWAFTLAATISSVLAAILGIAGGFAGMYLYDGGNSKGDDLAVLTVGLLAVGTFAFVVLFTWLRTLHHKISSRTPLFAWLFCLAGTLVVTVWLWPSYTDRDHYLYFIYMGWIAILVFGLVGLVVSHRSFIREPD